VLVAVEVDVGDLGLALFLELVQSAAGWGIYLHLSTDTQGR
jgi:hypothetical protein